MTTRTALLGMHHQMARTGLRRVLTGKFEVTAVETVEEMFAHCQVRQYDLYVMDVNLGMPGAEYIEPAQRVYELLQQQVQQGLLSGLERKFYGISGGTAAKIAQEAGIPAVLNVDLMEIARRL